MPSQKLSIQNFYGDKTVRDEAGRNWGSEAQQFEKWRQHFTKVLNNFSNETRVEDVDTPENLDITVASPS